MAEVHTEVKTYMTKMMCDCGGEMLPEGNSCVATYPPQYLHMCNKCGRTELYLRLYPCLNHVGNIDLDEK